MSKFGWQHPTIHAAGKFYFAIAGDPRKAERDFRCRSRIPLEEAAQQLVDSVD